MLDAVLLQLQIIYGTYDRSLTSTINIRLLDSLLSRFDLLFIVLDQMDPEIDGQISEHVLRMHHYRSALDGGDGMLDATFGRETEVNASSSVYVEFNRKLHGKKARKGKKQDALKIKFLKKYIHYAKHIIKPELSDEASEQIATAYAELRNANSNAKGGGGGGTLPITARTLETIIRLSTAHAKLKLSKTVSTSDVEAALKVMNFAIYHKELTDMDEREQARETENERKRKADNDGSNSERARRTRRDNNSSNGDGTATEGGATDAMEEDEPPSNSEIVISPERVEAFETTFGQYMRANHLDVISITDIENLINEVATNKYSREEIMHLLERLQSDNRLMIVYGMVHMM